MTVEEYQETVVNGLASLSTLLSDILNMTTVLCLIAGGILIYLVIHNMMNRR